MKTIGLLGGMGWESTAVYYRVLNQEVRRRLGGFHAAHIVLESFDFAVLNQLQEAGDWHAVEQLLADGAKRLEQAGADFWLIACNTVHRVTDAIEAQVRIPFLHIADPAGEALSERGIGRVALLGTAHTMQSDFYQRRLEERFGIETRVPDEPARDRIHRLILDELVHGIVSPEARATLDEIAQKLATEGCGATLLACTELGLLYQDEELKRPDAGCLDTARLHAIAAVELATSE